MLHPTLHRSVVALALLSLPLATKRGNGLQNNGRKNNQINCSIQFTYHSAVHYSANISVCSVYSVVKFGCHVSHVPPRAGHVAASKRGSHGVPTGSRDGFAALGLFVAIVSGLYESSGQSKSTGRPLMENQILPEDFKEFLKLLSARAVDYLLIGGYAVVSQTSFRPRIARMGTDFLFLSALIRAIRGYLFFL